MQISKAGSWNDCRPFFFVRNLMAFQHFVFPPVDHRLISSASFQDSSKNARTAGFTLIEVIVVISLMSVMLIFAFPRLSGFLTADNKNRAGRWIISQNLLLKTKAVQDKTAYILRVDISGNRFSTMPASEAEKETAIAVEAVKKTTENSAWEINEKSGSKAVRNKFVPGGELTVVGVAFPEGETVQSGTADIVFYEQGYSDRAIIHMCEQEDRFSFYIAPFLNRVQVYEGHI